MESERLMMDPNAAASALEGVNRTEQRLAERARWPFHRHALFGLAEGLIVAGVAQPTPIAAAAIVAAMVLVVVCIMDDRRRHGIIISGWQEGATRPLTLALAAFALMMAMFSAFSRDGESAQSVGYLLGGVTFVVCTAASLLWERVYRAQLTGRAE
jgi:hypothetical protein